MGRKYTEDLHRGSHISSTGASKQAKECRVRKQGQQEDGAKCGMWADRNYMKERPEAEWNLFREQKSKAATVRP